MLLSVTLQVTNTSSLCKTFNYDFIIALAILYAKYIHISNREIDTDSLALSLGGRVDRARLPWQINMILLFVLASCASEFHRVDLLLLLCLVVWLVGRLIEAALWSLCFDGEV